MQFIAMSLRDQAFMFVQSAFHFSGRTMSMGDRAVLMVRVQDAIRGGLEDAVEVAVRALRIEGYPARYEVRGECGTVVMDPPSPPAATA